MSWLPYIPSDGEYRIKVYNSNQFVEYDPSSGTWLKLVNDYKQNSDKQQVRKDTCSHVSVLIAVQFRFTYQGRGSCYKIKSCFDETGLYKFQTKDTYWGYGYTRGGNDDSDIWVVESKQSQYAKYSSLTCTDLRKRLMFDARVYKEGNTDPWDCESEDKCVSE